MIRTPTTLEIDFAHRLANWLVRRNAARNADQATGAILRFLVNGSPEAEYRIIQPAEAEEKS